MRLRTVLANQTDLKSLDVCRIHRQESIDILFLGDPDNDIDFADPKPMVGFITVISIIEFEFSVNELDDQRGKIVF